MPRNIGMKLIPELMRNSRRSDRELARILGTSQPTVTRIRTKLEKEGFIREYTIIPDFCRIGYTLIAITFTDVKQILDRKGNPEEEEFAIQLRFFKCLEQFDLQAITKHARSQKLGDLCML